MVDLNRIKEIVNQVAVQAATTVMMVFTNTDKGLQLATVPNKHENQRQ